MKTQYWKQIERHDMADHLGLDLWGNTPAGDLRIGHKGYPQPSFSMTYAEFDALFNSKFRCVPVRPGGLSFTVIAKTEGNG